MPEPTEQIDHLEVAKNALLGAIAKEASTDGYDGTSLRDLAAAYRILAYDGDDLSRVLPGKR